MLWNPVLGRCPFLIRPQKKKFQGIFRKKTKVGEGGVMAHSSTRVRNFRVYVGNNAWKNYVYQLTGSSVNHPVQTSATTTSHLRSPCCYPRTTQILLIAYQLRGAQMSIPATHKQQPCCDNNMCCHENSQHARHISLWFYRCYSLGVNSGVLQPPQYPRSVQLLSLHFLPRLTEAPHAPGGIRGTTSPVLFYCDNSLLQN